MSLLHLIPQNWHSWKFRVEQEGVTVASLQLSSFREKGTLWIEDSAYEIRRSSLDGELLIPKRGFLMRSPSGEYVAHAYKPSFWRRSMIFRYGANDVVWTLQPASIWGRRLLLYEGKEEVGSITPSGPFTRRAQAHMPDRLPLRLQVFAVWLTALMWKRESNAGAVAAVTVAGK